MSIKKSFTPLVFLTTALIGSAIYISSCTYDVATPNICFQEEVLPIFVSKCANAGCHDPITRKEKLDFTTYEGIMKEVVAGKPYSSEAYSEIASGSMPPSTHTQLTKLEKTIIKNWIKSGAPNSSNCNTCDTSVYTFAARVKPLMDKWCVGCHNTGNAGGNHDLSTYNGIKTSLATGRFLGSIQHTSGFSQMPKSASKLSDCDLNAIVKWVNAGALNN